VERLNRFPQGAPPSELLYKILEILFSEREAALVAQLPIKPFRAKTASRAWKLPLGETRKLLDALASRAILLDLRGSKDPLYTLPPPMAGFFEFSLMRVRHDIDQKTLAELFYQYLNVEEDFARELFTRGETRLGRVFVREDAVAPELEVLDYERASEVVAGAAEISVGICYCRHKMEHVGRACNAPRSICMTFGGTAHSLVKHGFGRSASAEECLSLLDEAREAGLVQFGENVRRGVTFICNCCGCCCEALLAAQRFGLERTIQTTRFIAEIDASSCNGCGKCVQACPVGALALERRGDHAKRKHAVRDPRTCLGCGVCVRACPEDGVRMVARAERVITPLDSAHRIVLMAIERGTLQNLIFDNQAHLSHRAMGAVLGVILRLPPVKQALASQQLKSRYLEALLQRRAAG
jgi:NAD-dependent dihydropyrimidine dehydrogenase PreA subunit